ncbi:YgiT-type zinc finger protein [Bacillus sp. JJ1609]|uniref:YgiT-type zinc finger protein n=1 Tax=Bacillus sp. JJ1609 TaxID=3122977 RepID=UPI002FFDAC34
MQTQFCPTCGSKMIEDAAEEIHELPDGSVQIDAIYPAWVCSRFCGYYEKMDCFSGKGEIRKGS